MELLVNKLRKIGSNIGFIVKCILCSIWFLMWFAMIFDNLEQPIGVLIILLIGIIPPIFVLRKPLLLSIRTRALYKKNMEEVNSLNEGLPVLQNVSLFNKNDIVHYYQSAKLQISDRQLAGQESISNGYSYKGFIRDEKQYNQESSVFTYKDIYEQYPGVLVVTNGKILFIKSEKGFEVNISDISDITIYLDAIGIQSGNMNYIVLVDNPIYFYNLLDLVKAYYNI